MIATNLYIIVAVNISVISRYIYYLELIYLLLKVHMYLLCYQWYILWFKYLLSTSCINIDLIAASLLQT